jgi:4-amino-4-deoxy-L-arabinose transferase-like glycosyltransferase
MGREPQERIGQGPAGERVTQAGIPLLENRESAKWRLGVAALAVYSLGLLSIGIRNDWRLMHEDNGAVETTLALSHLELGLAVTRAHDLFFNPHTGEAHVYGHHPPATALLVAAAFRVTGSDEPWVARSVVIAFELGSLLLLVSLLRRFFSVRASLVGGFLFATLPMGAFFGRMVNAEPICLFFVLLQLHGLSRLCESEWRRGFGLLASGIVLGGVVAWASFFFAAAIAGVAGFRAFRGERRALRVALFAGGLACAVFVCDLVHLWWSGHGSLAPLSRVASLQAYQLPDLSFLFNQLENYRRYFSHAGLWSSLLTAALLAFPGSRLAQRCFAGPSDRTLRSVLWAAGVGPSGYVLAAPFWAVKHVFWQFYFLPFAVFSLLLAGGLLWNASGKGRHAWRAVVVFFALECLVTSGYVLWVRHTRVGPYAVESTAGYRRDFLVPRSYRAP